MLRSVRQSAAVEMEFCSCGSSDRIRYLLAEGLVTEQPVLSINVSDPLY